MVRVPCSCISWISRRRVVTRPTSLSEAGRRLNKKRRTSRSPSRTAPRNRANSVSARRAAGRPVARTIASVTTYWSRPGPGRHGSHGPAVSARPLALDQLARMTSAHGSSSSPVPAMRSALNSSCRSSQPGACAVVPGVHGRGARLPSRSARRRLLGLRCGDLLLQGPGRRLPALGAWRAARPRKRARGSPVRPESAPIAALPQRPAPQPARGVALQAAQASICFCVTRPAASCRSWTALSCSRGILRCLVARSNCDLRRGPREARPPLPESLGCWSSYSTAPPID